jgi:hypothetical protein
VGNQPPHAVATATPSNSHTTGFTSQLSATGSTDPDGDPLTYAWDLDGDGQFDDATGPTTSDFYSTPGVKRPAVQVSDDHGHSSVATVHIQAGNTPPVAQITSPTSDLQWATGDTIHFSATATDAEETLPASAYTWKIVLHHCPSNCHTHGSGEVDGATSGSFTAPDHDYPAYLEVRLTVTDDGGLADTEPLSDTESVNVYPSTEQLTLQTTPPGFQLGLDGAVDPSPFTSTVIENSHHAISAPHTVQRAGVTYQFQSWTDGGAATHTITTKHNSVLTAHYTSDTGVSPPPSSSPPPAPTVTTKKRKCKKHGKKSARAAKAKCKKKKKH